MLICLGKPVDFVINNLTDIPFGCCQIIPDLKVHPEPGTVTGVVLKFLNFSLIRKYEIKEKRK